MKALLVRAAQSEGRDRAAITAAGSGVLLAVAHKSIRKAVFMKYKQLSVLYRCGDIDRHGNRVVLPSEALPLLWSRKKDLPFQTVCILSKLRK